MASHTLACKRKENEMTKYARERMTMETAAIALNHPYGYRRAYEFHRAMGLTISDRWDVAPPVSERLLRGRLLIEEVLETLNAMGLTLSMSYEKICDLESNWSTNDTQIPLDADDIQIQHVEGSVYDPIETADGLADIKVITNGTAVAFGIPMLPVDLEVFASNMSKLDENGKPVINKCHACTPGIEHIDRANLTCEDEHHRQAAWTDPDKPLGKLLKPASYIPANIRGIYEAYTTQIEGK